MDISNGRIIGIGVGTGGPGALTIDAVDAIRGADVICLPQGPKERCAAYRTAAATVPRIEEKPCACFDFKMTRDEQELARIHAQIYAEIRAIVLRGQCAAFLTIGDPSVYSTFAYIAECARRDGLRVETIAGVPSFCAAAAHLGIPLCEGDGELHIGTGLGDVQRLLSYPGTKVILKCGRNMKTIRELLYRQERETGAKVCAVSECGTSAERRYYGAASIPEEESYMTTIIVRE